MKVIRSVCYHSHRLYRDHGAGGATISRAGRAALHPRPGYRYGMPSVAGRRAYSLRFDDMRRRPNLDQRQPNGRLDARVSERGTLFLRLAARHHGHLRR